MLICRFKGRELAHKVSGALWNFMISHVTSRIWGILRQFDLLVPTFLLIFEFLIYEKFFIQENMIRIATKSFLPRSHVSWKLNFVSENLWMSRDKWVSLDSKFFGTWFEQKFGFGTCSVFDGTLSDRHMPISEIKNTDT